MGLDRKLKQVVQHNCMLEHWRNYNLVQEEHNTQSNQEDNNQEEDVVRTFFCQKMLETVDVGEKETRKGVGCVISNTDLLYYVEISCESSSLCEFGRALADVNQRTDVD